jgi:hypothetical protein
VVIAHPAAESCLWDCRRSDKGLLVFGYFLGFTFPSKFAIHDERLLIPTLGQVVSASRFLCLGRFSMVNPRQERFSFLGNVGISAMLICDFILNRCAAAVDAALLTVGHLQLCFNKVVFALCFCWDAAPVS